MVLRKFAPLALAVAFVFPLLKSPVVFAETAAGTEEEVAAGDDTTAAPVEVEDEEIDEVLQEAPHDSDAATKPAPAISDDADKDADADADDEATPAAAATTAQEDLDQATQLKVTAEGLGDLNDVIDKLDSAMEKGLDKDNQEFAKQLMISTLLQRAQALSAAILERPLQDPRWMQVRQFALTDLQRALELDPGLPEAQLLIGRLQAMPLGDPNAARRALSKVIDSESADSDQKSQSYALRGALQSDETKRMADFDKAIELEPTKPDYYRVRGQYLYGKDKFQDALADIDKALELAPDDATTLELRGLILLGLDRLDDALASFNKAGEIAPDAVLPYQHRGEVYRRQGDLKKAAEQLTKALELAPNDPGTLLLRGTVYYQLDDTDHALADIDAVLARQPQLLMAHLLKAEIFAGTGRVDQAIEQLERLVTIAPDQVRLLDPLGRYYLIGGKPRKCIETFSKVLEIEPENYAALRFRGDAYLNIGKHKEAVADFDRAVVLTDNDDSLLNNFAWVLATSPVDEVRDGKRSVELAKKAAEQTSYNVPHILSTLAAAYAETGDFDEAQKWSQKSIDVCQTELDAATKEDDRKRLETDMGNLKKELQNYKDKKPTREVQTQEEAASQPAPQASSDTFAPSSAVPAPARTLDF